MISFSENHESFLIPFEDGQALAAFANPQEEGLKWAYSLGKISSEHVIVIGLGAGFHIAALADIYPEIKITVVDSRQSLNSVFRSQFAEYSDRIQVIFAENEQDLLKSSDMQDILISSPFVISFAACWGTQNELFARFFAHLTGRSEESIRYHLESIGMDMKASVGADRLLSIKDILPLIENQNSENAQIFKALGELIK